ncbi:MAG: hypothetical protein NTW21_39220, partial [Verrucomicrobia bacterium]|nr:hypothetical protein [Verrucomicrobiota bacterium]
MKKSFVFSIAAFAMIALTGCNKSNPAVEKKLSELERQNREALERQQQLERQLAEQQLVSERDAIERERMRIEDERAALEQEQGADAAAKQAALANREQELAKREGKLEGLEASLTDKQRNLEQRDQVLSGRELELAGREDLADPADTAAPVEPLPVADYGMFYDSLSSYGSWFEAPDYGYVWQPAVVRTVGWRPYMDGSWVCTNHGWTWLSNEPFGWACYHYGRWALLRSRGWVWVPGDQWAPAWVCWRESGSHIGWAPLPPETLGWRDCTWDSTVETRFGISAGWFNFVAITHFASPIRPHCLPVADNLNYHRQTTNITNIRCHERSVFVGGPRYQDLCRSIGRPAPYYQLNLNQHQRPGRDLMAMRPQRSGNRLTIAAPAIHADWNAALRPTRVREQLKDVAIERPQPLEPEVVNHFRQQREQDRLHADQAMTELGGREAFKQRRTQVLETNQREAAALAKPPAAPERGLQPARPAATAQTPPTRPQRPDRPSQAIPDATQPPPAAPEGGLQPARPAATAQTPPTRPQRPDRPSQAIPDATRPPPAAPERGLQPARPAATAQTPPTRPQRPDRPSQAIPDATQPPPATPPADAVQPSPGERVKRTDPPRPVAVEPPPVPDRRRPDRQPAATPTRPNTPPAATPDTNAAQQEQARQRQAEEANQQQALQAEAQRQRAAEAALQRQTEEANQQKQQQAETQRQRAAEAALQRQTEEANQQKQQQAEAQRQRAAE